MNESYHNLFLELCRAAEVLAERVMEYDKEKNDEKGYTTAEMMRSDYRRLSDNIKANKELEYNDYAKILAAAYMVANNLQDQITAYQKTVNGYKIDVIPKLSRVLEETKDDAEAMKNLVKELFETKI